MLMTHATILVDEVLAPAGLDNAVGPVSATFVKVNTNPRWANDGGWERLFCSARMDLQQSHSRAGKRKIRIEVNCSLILYNRLFVLFPLLVNPPLDETRPRI